MKVKIPYEDKDIEVEVQKKDFNELIYPNEVEKKDEKQVIKDAIDEPIGTPPFSRFVEDGTLFIVNDATRATPTSKVLKMMEDQIEENDVRFVVARGSHRDPTEEEYKNIFGGIYERYPDKIFSHDAEDDEMVDYGTTSRGTPVKFNELLAQSKNVVAINSVEPHYFAGYTGGRKSLLPGIASYETIENNHSHAMEDGALALKLRGNPVHEDMMEAIGLIDKEIFSLNITLDKENNIFHASAGDIEETFIRETKKAKEVFAVTLEKKSEVVVASAHPLDGDLYQSLKALENGKLALKEGGIIILVAECEHGIGPSNFYDLLSSLKTPEETVEEIKKGYRLGYHKAGRMADLASCWEGKESSDIWSVTQLDDEIERDIFITPKDSLQNAVDEALEKTSGTVTFLKEGNMVVPLV